LVTSAHERHTVQIYETDGYLAQRIVDFVATGLRADERCIVVATRAHREIVQTALEGEGIDVGNALASGNLVMLDARDTLANFMIADVPDTVRFDLSVGAAIARATRDGKRVRAFGEMVDLLWRDGLPEAALTLERMWNDLATKYDFDLLCAYTMSNLYKTSSSRFREVCDLHDHVHPLERTTTESTTDSARLIVAEIARRA
jgi:KaiC/GvpD/RAD55 family RecA-like ATPase